MTSALTRRGFGQLAIGGLATFAADRAYAGTDYVNPQLLVHPEDLISRVNMTATGRPEYEDDGLILIDVRSREEHAAGHIPGARPLEPNAVVAAHSPISGSLKPIQELADLLGAVGVSAKRRVVFYDDRGGFHAARMFWLLEYLGHRNVAVLNGGLSAWINASGALEQGVQEHDSVQFEAAPSPRRFATAEDILSQRESAGAVLVDVRPSRMFDEGHIPWAINVPWAMNLDLDGRFLSADALAKHFEAFGVSPDKSVIMHCQVGLASSHSYVALRLLGYRNVKVYHRSWAEWGEDPSLPQT